MSSAADEVGDDAGSDVATIDDLTGRIASIRDQIVALEERITGERATLTFTSEPWRPSPIEPAMVDRELLPDQGDAADNGGPGDHRAPSTEHSPPGIRVERVQPAPGVDPDDPVLALGVADPDALTAWLTDETALIDPNATDEHEPVTAEMDAVTKPSIYSSLAADESERLWRSVAPHDEVGAHSADGDDGLFDSADTRGWLTLVVVAAVLIGLGVVLTLWLSGQSETANGAVFLLGSHPGEFDGGSHAG